MQDELEKTNYWIEAEKVLVLIISLHARCFYILDLI